MTTGSRNQERINQWATHSLKLESALKSIEDDYGLTLRLVLP